VTYACLRWFFKNGTHRKGCESSDDQTLKESPVEGEWNDGNCLIESGAKSKNSPMPCTPYKDDRWILLYESFFPCENFSPI